MHHGVVCFGSGMLLPGSSGECASCLVSTGAVVLAHEVVATVGARRAVAGEVLV